MEHIRISNLRCLADSSAIEIRPISLLVGANSSGKSTFLRVFPLLKQSHEMRTLGGLVLNEGDVNFGFFHEALRKGAAPPELKLEFGFTLAQTYFQGTAWNRYLVEPINISCELIYVHRAQDPRYPRLRALNLSLKAEGSTDTIVITADDDGGITEFQVNTFSASNDEKKALRLRIGRGLVPQLVTGLTKDDSLDSSFESDRGTSPFDKRLLSETNIYFHGRTARETRLATFRDIKLGSPEKMLEQFRQTGAWTWRERVRDWKVSSVPFQNLRNLLLANRTSDILESVNLYVSQLAQSVHYFQPVRASAERDYLSRDVSVTSVNSTGLNVAMVLASLSTSDQMRFRSWMGEHFGFEVFPQSVGDGARVSLRMKDTASGSEFNLADTGFGFSQMLPFLVQVWSLIEHRESRQPSVRRRSLTGYYSWFASSLINSFIIAIEQPELHLHPALQARLADLIVTMTRVSKKQGVPVRFVLETHSQTIIERIGQCVESKLLETADVQVILFELDRNQPNNNISKVRIVNYDDQGILTDWPFGFFSAPPIPPARTENITQDVV